MTLPSALPPKYVPRHLEMVTKGAMRYAAAGNRMQYGDFGASGGSADYELMNALPVVRNKIRALARNSGTMKRYLSLLKSNVVGENGFNLQVRVRRSVDGKPDKVLNTRVETAWHNFCKSPTVDGEMDMIEFEKQMVTTWARDGEYIVEIVRDPTAPDGFYLNPIEGDLLDETLNNRHPATGNQIKMGVEITSRGRPVAYHFLVDHPGDMSWEIRPSNKRHRRIPASRVIHVFERLRPGQTRGEPQPSSLVGTTKMLDGYREAEITGRRVKSSAMGLFIEKDMADATGGLDGMADRTSENKNDVEQYEMDIEPGTFKMAPRGYDFKQFDPGGAVSDFAEFDGQIKTDASMGVSISPVSLGYETRKLSYSTHRGVIAEDREMYRDLQSFFIRMAMNKIYTFWLVMHMSYNINTLIPATRKMAIIAASKFTGRSWKQIDPTKDTKAENDQLAARTTSLSRICADRGISRDDLLDEIEDDEQALKDRGLTQYLGGAMPAETTSGGDDDEDDDDGDAGRKPS